MKYLLVFLTVVSFNLQASTSKIKCTGMDGYTEVSTLRDLNVEGMRDIECDESFFSGDVCYVGNRKGVSSILKKLSAGELLMDGEVVITNIKILKSSISYALYDTYYKRQMGNRVRIKKCN